MEKCKSCESIEIISYNFTKCNSCGEVYSNFGNFNNKTRLKIVYKEDLNKLVITGNKEGLEFLANRCLRIIGKTDPSGHIHLEWQMNNLLKDSIETILEFSDKPDKY